MPTRAASGLAGRGRQPRHGLHDAQPGPHRALDRVLVRSRPAEIGQHAVAHQLGDMTLEARHRTRDRVLVRAEHVPHLLRVEPAREGRGADQVGEHDGELPSLGLPRLGGGLRQDGLACRRLGTTHGAGRGGVTGMQGSDRVDQLAPVADSDDPDLPQVLDREPRQDIGVNAVLGERPRVLPQAQALEPSRDVHAHSSLADLPEPSWIGSPT